MTAGDPSKKRKVTWIKNGKDLVFGSLQSLHHSRILENELQINNLVVEGKIDTSCVKYLLNIAMPDSGQYGCQIMDGGIINEDTISITVEQNIQVDLPEDCEDQPHLAKCHLVVLMKACSKSKDLAR